MTTIALLHSRLRAEEQLLLQAAQRLDIPLRPIHDGDQIWDLDKDRLAADAVLARSISTYRTTYALRFLRAHGIPAINPLEVAETCSDKTETSLRLRKAGIPTPDTRVAFTPEAALAAIEEIGYPAVIKPTLGSWARLIARVENRDQAQQLLEHREALPNPIQHIHYIQAYVEKSQDGNHRDLRAFVVGDETIAAVWRTSPHWITNTAQGAVTTNRPMDDTLNDLCLRTAAAVGGGVLAIDLMEDPNVDGGLTVHEVNHTMEFRNSIQPTGIDIPGRILQHCIDEAHR